MDIPVLSDLFCQGSLYFCQITQVRLALFLRCHDLCRTFAIAISAFCWLALLVLLSCTQRISMLVSMTRM
jgi:hypothetical protein